MQTSIIHSNKRKNAFYKRENIIFSYQTHVSIVEIIVCKHNSIVYLTLDTTTRPCQLTEQEKSITVFFGENSITRMWRNKNSTKFLLR